MVCGRRCQDRIGFIGGTVHFREASEKTRYRASAHRKLQAPENISLSCFSAHDPEAFFLFGILDPHKVLGQKPAKASVYLEDAVGACNTPMQAASIDALLNGDVRFCFQLKVALVAILTVIILQRSLNIEGVGVVAFDQIAVVTV